MAKLKFKIDGMKELEKTFRKLRDVPQKAVTPAAKKGMTIALKDARKNAPWLTGDLSNGLIMVGEKYRPSRRGKKVYQVVPDRKYNFLFVKFTKTGKRYYYPASQEYGFVTVNGGYVPGAHYLRNSIDNNAPEIRRTMVEEVARRIDKLR